MMRNRGDQLEKITGSSSTETCLRMRMMKLILFYSVLFVNSFLPVGQDEVD